MKYAAKSGNQALTRNPRDSVNLETDDRIFQRSARNGQTLCVLE